MTRAEYVLAVMALQGADAALTPVQAQKLFFILDKEIPQKIEGRRFNFAPYDYGPFDAAVYSEIEKMASAGLTQVQANYPYRIYKLSADGYAQGQTLAQQFQADIQEYIRQVGGFVRGLSFQQLVSAVYKNYPEMRAKSVFRE